MAGPFRSRIADEVLGDPGFVGLASVRAADLAELDRLMKDRDVAAWWPDFHMEDLAEFLTHDYVTPFKIVVSDQTVGFLQVYHANCDEFWVRFGVPRETFGIDLAIGDAIARERGVGRKVLGIVIQRLFQWPEVKRVQVDPDADNARAIKAFTAAGFVPQGEFPGYDGDTMLYMTVDR